LKAISRRLHPKTLALVGEALDILMSD